MIRLDCRPSSSLSWDPPASGGGKILWYLDLGLDTPHFPLDDPIHFEALKLSLTQFTDHFFPKYRERTQGVILYRGSADFEKYFLWTPNQEENFCKWGGGGDLQKRLFAADAFIHYFQMLSYSLPDDLPIHLWLDANIRGTLAERHLLLSKERFEHFNIGIKDLPFTSALIWDGNEEVSPVKTSSRGLCFPTESMCTFAALEGLDRLFDQIEKPFRVIFEPFLNEDWEGLDEIYILKESVSPQGARKLKGFEATGGRISG